MVHASPEVAKNTDVSIVRSLITIGGLFFVFGFVTWVGSVLIPYLKIACELNNFEAYLVAFSFYISYLFMAIPSVWVLKKTGLKRGISLGLMIMSLGASIFVPAALMRTYSVFLFGLFVQGAGLAILQTASNPYITILGPRESAARRISIMGICHGIAGILAPIILGSIILENAEGFQSKLVTMNLSEKIIELDALAVRVIIPYFIIAEILAILAFFSIFFSIARN